MSVELANSVHDIVFSDRTSTVDLAILEKAAKADVGLPKTHVNFQPFTDVKLVAKKQLALVREKLQLAVKNEKTNPLEAEKAKIDLKAMDEAAGKTNWKKVAAFAAVGGGAGYVGAKIGSQHQHDDSSNIGNSTDVTASPTTSDALKAPRSLTDLD
ncbi:hypothetical protein FRB98_002666 [Tulasnella sp. 332]|nr:hypothetical protein FRB98_002666 [Tulasnella sp. 332]